MKKCKWNYATVKSIFGNVWVGKTKLKPDGKKIFSSFDEANKIRKQNITAAEFEMENPEEECCIINKSLEKFISDVR